MTFRRQRFGQRLGQSWPRMRQRSVSPSSPDGVPRRPRKTRRHKEGATTRPMREAMGLESASSPSCDTQLASLWCSRDPGTAQNIFFSEKRPPKREFSEKIGEARQIGLIVGEIHRLLSKGGKRRHTFSRGGSMIETKRAGKNGGGALHPPQQ